MVQYFVGLIGDAVDLDLKKKKGRILNLLVMLLQNALQDMASYTSCTLRRTLFKEYSFVREECGSGETCERQCQQQSR